MDDLDKDIEIEKRKKEDRRVIFILSFISICMILIPLCLCIFGK